MGKEVKGMTELIKEFLVDLKSIGGGYKDYFDNLVSGDELNEIIKKWEKRLIKIGS